MQRTPNENFSDPPAKRRRGRPSGSKNKPKPSSSIRPHVLQISSGGDIAEAMASLARRLGGYLSILTANGPVSSAVLKKPSWPSAGDLTLSGCYEIVSMSASFGGGISVTMAGMNGEVVGGILKGPLMAAGKVVVVVAELLSPMVHELLEAGELDSAEEKDFGAVDQMEDEAGNLDGGGGNDDEWCRNWFGQCEIELRQCFFGLAKDGEVGEDARGHLLN